MKSRPNLAIYSFAHFCVDFCCFFILFNGAAKTLPKPAVAFLVYNVVAFGLQFIIGYYCDENPRFPAALLGCGLVAAGLLASRFAWAALALCALGNAFFHIGGGSDTLRRSNGRLTPNGIFVSTGALGVALGTALGGSSSPSIYIPLGLIAAAAALIAVFCDTKAPERITAKPVRIVSALPFVPALVFSLGSIAARAFVGPLVPAEWKTTAVLAFLPYLAACLGKAAGGLFADRFGARTVGTLALVLSAPLLIFGGQTAVVSLAGIFLFNFTMPVNLCAVFSLMPDNPGLSFGLTTLALLLGTVPLSFVLPENRPLVIGVVVAASALFTFLSTKNIRNFGEKRAKTEL